MLKPIKITETAKDVQAAKIQRAIEEVARAFKQCQMCGTELTFSDYHDNYEVRFGPNRDNWGDSMFVKYDLYTGKPIKTVTICGLCRRLMHDTKT